MKPWYVLIWIPLQIIGYLYMGPEYFQYSEELYGNMTPGEFVVYHTAIFIGQILVPIIIYLALKQREKRKNATIHI